MSTMKKCQVVMLPINEKQNIGISIELVLLNNRLINPASGAEFRRHLNDGGIIQNLYFLSDDEIKEGDWCYDEYNKVVFKNNSIGIPGASKKIIATTDESLNEETLKENPPFSAPYSKFSLLPQPSQSFIERYIEEYNKGQKIETILVEYEEYFDLVEGAVFTSEKWWNKEPVSGKSLKPRVNPKDNTITIKKYKDNWNKGEIIKLIQDKIDEYSCGGEGDIEYNALFGFKDWIEENL